MVWLRIERRSRGAFRTTLENSWGEGRPLHHPVAGRTHSAQMAALVRDSQQAHGWSKSLALEKAAPV